jgi:hypothetical protein
LNITKHFTLAEASFSEYATRHGIDNTVPEELLTNIRRQAELMEKIRYELDSPIYITSWYRCPELNQAIGGAVASFHKLGLACDFISSFGTPLEICKVIQKSGIEFDQLIDEGTWVHIGLSPLPPRHEILTARFPNGKAVYSKGLIYG